VLGLNGLSFSLIRVVVPVVVVREMPLLLGLVLALVVLPDHANVVDVGFEFDNASVQLGLVVAASLIAEPPFDA